MASQEINHLSTGNGADKEVRMDNDQAIDSGTQSQEPVAQPVQTQSESTPPAEKPAEKMFTQSQLQAIAAKESRKAEERTEARLRAEFAQQSQQSQQSPTLGGIKQTSPEEIQRLIRQEAFTMSREHQAKQIEENWLSAMDAERLADPEFSDLYDAIDIEQQPGLILAMAGMDNKAQVVKDLAKNPSKYANILMLANGAAPKLAQMELNKLSASIKSNEDAKKQPKIDAPLSHLKPSNIGGDDGKSYSSMSTSDFRKQSWLRG